MFIDYAYRHVYRLDMFIDYRYVYRLDMLGYIYRLLIYVYRLDLFINYRHVYGP